MAETIGVQGSFAHDTALQDAVAKLTLAGFDRADLSVDGMGDGPAAPPRTETDTRQTRTLATSMAGTAGAFAAAGVTIATGGAAALAVGAALAAGVGAAGLTNLGGSAAAERDTTAGQAAGTSLPLTLRVRARNTDQLEVAKEILRDAGAAEISLVEQATLTASAAWTG